MKLDFKDKDISGAEKTRNRIMLRAGISMEKKPYYNYLGNDVSVVYEEWKYIHYWDQDVTKKGKFFVPIPSEEILDYEYRGYKKHENSRAIQTVCDKTGLKVGSGQCTFVCVFFKSDDAELQEIACRK